MAALKDPVAEREDRRTTRVTHVVDAADAPYALCGYRCTTFYPYGSRGGTECVVCAELEKVNP